MNETRDSNNNKYCAPDTKTKKRETRRREKRYNKKIASNKHKQIVALLQNISSDL